MNAIIYFVSGAVFGVAITWLLLKSRSDSSALTTKLNETQGRLEEYIVEVAEKKEQLRAAEEKLELIDEAKEKLSDTFKALSAEALKSNNQSFLELAKENLEKFQEGAKGDLEKRQQAIDELIKPINESLKKFDVNVKEIEKDRVGAYESLTQQVKHLFQTSDGLRNETSNLVKALRAPIARGQWGELQLKRVAEMAGMVDRCDFFEQASVDTDEDRRKRPDMLVKLPGDKNIIVDAKAPLEAYLDAIEAEDDEREEKLNDVSRQIRDRIKELSTKEYWKQFKPTPEFVVLFLPFESLFSIALEKEKDLIEVGAKQRVILATPTTLIALLRVVAYGWKEEKLAENARNISKLGGDLYERIATMGGHLFELGKSLGKSVESYDKTVRSIETRVMPQARKFKEFGAASGDVEIKTLETIDKSPREIQTPEMLELFNNK
jgi:DNA recombination protein RmuC